MRGESGAYLAPWICLPLKCNWTPVLCPWVLPYPFASNCYRIVEAVRWSAISVERPASYALLLSQISLSIKWRNIYPGLVHSLARPLLPAMRRKYSFRLFCYLRWPLVSIFLVKSVLIVSTIFQSLYFLAIVAKDHHFHLKKYYSASRNFIFIIR